MAHAQMLSAMGLTRPSRRRGFCPACRLFQTGDTPQEIAAPTLIALAFLLIAALAWVLTIVRMSSMDDMAMGLGSFDAFVASWTVMMAAMMFPSALPVVFEFAQRSERRRGWQAATAVLGATYLGIWLAFGVGCYVIYNVLGMPWPNQGLIGGAALVVAGLYGLSPFKRATEAWCRERCALHSPLPFNLMRSAVVAGVRYGLSCLGCTAALMVAMVLIGISSLAWMIVLAALVLLYKIAPAPTPVARVAVTIALVALGIRYAAGA
jgi:predicted metal-binding membrane protein